MVTWRFIKLNIEQLKLGRNEKDIGYSHLIAVSQIKNSNLFIDLWFSICIFRCFLSPSSSFRIISHMFFNSLIFVHVGFHPLAELVLPLVAGTRFWWGTICKTNRKTIEITQFTDNKSIYLIYSLILGFSLLLKPIRTNKLWLRSKEYWIDNLCCGTYILYT